MLQGFFIALVQQIIIVKVGANLVREQNGV